MTHRGAHIARALRRARRHPRGAPETAQLAARNDLDAVRARLSNYTDTKTTFETYRTVRGHWMNWGDKDPVEPPARPPR
ncbi:Hypothetical protein RBRH_02635 [Mycetohabitans rhizoxinica HKI 454]|uniref:Uncharacterized protein n=1 Tax=Mycetohabitans rhizoxinica (strain DSM 19002 / CIP 109453 / HKI 454) TaxID=882378 RepID=E5AR92_MYCRK|nr:MULTISPECIES: hypothetical protein [Mycetohabitans]MCG1047202.1 hypothetical protein [Mycetohabitans sp. B6]CBW75124.1 Hypothetical protein RBRH_02635 [Mycetohabitans rhizoxinica HKI 454]